MASPLFLLSEINNNKSVDYYGGVCSTTFIANKGEP